MSQLGHLPSPGEEIDRYTVLAELAHGGMAAVFAVGRITTGFNKVLAMKVMLPHLVSEERFVNMFLDEARIAANVKHPNVVQVFDVGNHRRTPYLVMEYLEGQSLSEVRKRTELPAAALLEILASAADGLHAAHETCDRNGAALGIVHRDVSPQNIHVSYDGTVKVVDFGIAAAAGRMTQTQTGEVKGKFGYAAPEQLRPGRAIDRRLDVWAMGVVAYETLAGRRLFRGETDADTMFKVLKSTIEPLHQVAPDLPETIYEIIDACLERTVELRPLGMRELAQAFRKGAAELGSVDSATIGELISASFAEEKKVESQRVAHAIESAPSETTGRSVAPLARRGVRLLVLSLTLTLVLVVSVGFLWSEESAGEGQVGEAPLTEAVSPVLPMLEQATPTAVVAPEPPVPEDVREETREEPSQMRRRTKRAAPAIEPTAPTPRTSVDRDLVPLEF